MIAAISTRAWRLPTVSISQAVFIVSSRTISSSIRDSAIQSWMLAFSAIGLPNVTRLSARWHSRSSARSAMPIDAHAVVDAPGAEPRLADHEAVALAGQQRARRAPARPRTASRRGPRGPSSRTPAGRARSSRRACRSAPPASTAGGAAGRPGRSCPSRSARLQLRCSAFDVHHLRPLMTYSSPSRSIRVSMLVASSSCHVRLGHRERRPDLAVEQRTQPAAPCAPRCRTASAPPCCPCPARCSSSPPTQDAALRPMISASGAYSAFVRPGPHSAWGWNRFHSPRCAGLRLELLDDRRVEVRVAGLPHLLRRRPARPDRCARP